MAFRSWASSSSSSWTSKPARRNRAHSASDRALVTTEVNPRARSRSRQEPTKSADKGRIAVGLRCATWPSIRQLASRARSPRCSIVSGSATPRDAAPVMAGKRTRLPPSGPCMRGADQRRRFFPDGGGRSVGGMLLVATDPAFEQHDTGPGHPERARRLEAVLRGPEAAGLTDAVRQLEPREATLAELSRVHPLDYLEALERFCAAGGGDIDGDTRASAGSWRAGKLAVGAGLAAVEALRRGEGDAAFLAVPPPGHHALAAPPMGFCLINNIAVVAANLAEAGQARL